MSVLTSNVSGGRRPGFSLAWGLVAAVTQSTTTTTIAFDLYGAPTLDATTVTNLTLSTTPTLVAGDKILVAKIGQGAWVVIDKIEALEGST